MNRKRFMVMLLLAGLFTASRPIFAHHSVAEFDMRRLNSIKGAVTKFEWSNPHAYIHLDVKDDKGNVENWSAELASLTMLSRVNWRKDTVKAGDVITVLGNRAKDGRTMMHIDKIVFENGQELSAHVQ